MSRGQGFATAEWHLLPTAKRLRWIEASATTKERTMKLQLPIGMILWSVIFGSCAISQEFGLARTLADQEGMDETIGLVSHQVDWGEIACRSTCQERSYLRLTAEMPLYSVYANHGVGNNFFFRDFNTTPALRILAEYKTAGILGFRGSYFYFDASSDATPASEMRLDLYDLESFTGFRLGDWEFEGTGGLRWGRIGFSSNISGSRQEFDGFGFTVGGQVRRDIARGVSLVARVRQSMLYGDSGNSQVPANDLRNVVVPITEFRLGADYTRVLRSGNRLIAGIGFEHQQFSGLSVRNARIDPEDLDFALAGPVFSLSWEY